MEANPEEFEELLSANRKAYSVGTCLSIKTRPEIVKFDNVGLFGGIIQEGRPKPGDTLPANDRDRINKIIQKTRKTIKVRTSF